MSEDVSQYLCGFINREESLSELLNKYIEISNSKSCTLFVQDGDGNKHICLEQVGKTEYSAVEQTFSFEPTIPIHNIIINNETNVLIYYKTPYKIKTLMIIPIAMNKERLGVVCLDNNDSGYDEEVIIPLTPYISITQLILKKHKIIQDLKRNFSDSSSFSKDLFMANMSHEIRTPLNGVIGYNQLLLRTNLTTVQKGYLSSMNECSIQLMQIINDVLDFSKLASGKMSMNSECFRIQEVIDSVRDAMGARLLEKRQNITFSVCSDIPEFIISDKQKIIQVIVNLVSNASKFSGIEEDIEIKFNLCESENIIVYVKDNGIGISEQNQYKIFNTFMQLEESMYKIGAGLGLAICKKLVELLDGQIKVKSSIGVGSIFSFTFKFDTYEDYERIIERDVGVLKNKSILVVDDNADNRILLFEILFEWGMKPVMCASPLEALRMALGDRYKFAIGLIDICMPVTTGVELAEQIKEERPFFPLIALSSIDSFVSMTHFEKKLDKPLNKIQLFNAIHNVLMKSQSPSAYIGENESDTNSHDSNSPSSRYTKTLKILIVEDIMYNRNLLVNMLQNLNYKRIDTAENGKIALSMIMQAHEEGNPYDILLLDLRMPIMTGYNTMIELKELNITQPNIVIVTASVMEEDKQKCKNIGAKYFITKPIEMQQLKNVMLHLSDSEKIITN